MFDSFSRSFGSTPSHLADNDVSPAPEPTPDPFFGAIASYQICGCCGRFHGATDATEGGGQGVILGGDDRGVFGPNGKPSLDIIDAGTQITRTNMSWATGLGQPAVVTYAFRASATVMPTDTTGFSQFNSFQITATELALAAWSDVANITFNRVTDGASQYSNNATILFGNYAAGQSGAAAFAYLPGGMPGATGAGAVQGDVWINSSFSYNSVPVMQAYGQQVLLHEIGHAIGLSHPAAYNASANGVITYDDHAIYFEDSRQYTVMSYFSELATGANFGANRYSSVPLLDDIAAAQRLYGANTTTRTGDTTYGFNSNAGQPWFTANNSLSALIFAVWDAGGADTFDFSGYSVAQTIDLRQGSFSSVGGLVGNVAIALGVVIENVVGGTGADTIRGNSAGNLITGNGGNDEIDGGLGSDTVVFSGARASYTISWNGQVGTITGLGQTVTVSNVEFLKFSDQTIAAAPTGGLLVGGDATNEAIHGTAFADTIGGLGGDDTINGNGGADTLDGGSGDDVLNGGDGDDLLIGGRGDDALNGGAGHDIADYTDATSGITLNLATGVASGGGGADTLSGVEEVRGTAHADTITGDANANILHGGGGVDTLNGGGGNDQLFGGAPGEGGGAPDIVKAAGTANSTIGTAVSLNGGFDLGTRSDVADSTTIPHATVVATAHGGMEYYAFTVAAGDTVVFDIDNASFDSVLRVYNAGGAQLAQNDDDAAVDDGPPTDSGLSYTFATAGTYYVQVARWFSGTTDATLVTAPPPVGGTYTLHVSVPSATVVPVITDLGATMNGEAGDDEITGGVGRDTLNGGIGDDLLTGGGGIDTINGGDGTDTAAFSGNRAAYTISTAGGVTTVSGPDGTDSLTNVELLQFADGLFDITGAPVSTDINGTEGADVLNGTADGDAINGLGGDDVINGGAGNDTINGGGGTDTAVFSGTMAGSTVTTVAGVTTVTGPDGTDTLTNVERLRFSDGTLIVGANGGQYFAGTASADAISGTAFNDQIEAGGGNDTITGGAGNDSINGGSGTDTAVFSGARGGYNISTVNGVTTVTGPDGTDVLHNVERLQFADVTLDLAAPPPGVNRVGTAAADTLYGTDGNDVIDGRGGADVMSGNLGNDFYYVDSAADVIIDGLGQGTADRLFASVNYILGANAEIEVMGTTNNSGTDPIRLIGNDYAQRIQGNEGANTLNGMGGDDVLVGAGGNDILYGGAGRDMLNGGIGNDTLDGGAGVDQMFGGLGDDWYFVDDAGDSVFEAVGEGTGDRVFASVSWRLTTGAEIENLATSDNAGTAAINLTGNERNNIINGNAGANVLNGAEGDDVLAGQGGNDTLYGGAGRDSLNGGLGDDILDGGTGADIMVGGLGNDWYIIDHAQDYVDERVGGGTADRLFSGINYALAAGSEIEVLSTSSNASTTAINLTGNEFSQQVQGNEGNNVLNGQGGDDIVVGAGGDDTLYGGTGYDILNGGSGNDILDGGDGADHMSGGAGDDWYFVDNAADQIVEHAGQGADRVFASVSYALAAGVEVEQLQTAFNAGTSAINLTGNAYANTIYGNDGANVLSGREGNDVLVGLAGADRLNGGAGSDTLYGGDGNDTYVLGRGDGADVAYEASGTDTIEISGAFAPQDVLYEVVGRDLYVALRDPALPGQSASQCADHIRIIDGAVSGSAAQVERVTVGGQTVIIADLGLPFVQNAPAQAEAIGKTSDSPLVLPQSDDDAFVLEGDAEGPQVLPGPQDLELATGGSWTKGVDAPEVLPALSDDFLPTTVDDDRQVLPGLVDGSDLALHEPAGLKLHDEALPTVWHFKDLSQLSDLPRDELTVFDPWG